MKKAYLSILRLVFVILSFVLGLATALVAIVGAGYFIATNVTIDGLENFGIIIDTSAVLDDNAEKPIRGLTIMELIGEISEISSMADTKSLDDISEKYGLILPPAGESPIIDAMRTIPLAKLLSQEGLDTALSEVYIGTLLGYEKKSDNTDPDNPVEYWYDAANDKKVTGVELVLADYSLYKVVYEGVVVSEIMDSSPIGEFLGYTYDEEKKAWFDSNNVMIEGPMAYVANQYVSEVGTKINDATVGEILGYTKEDGEGGKWYKLADDGVTKEYMTGTMKAFADNKLDNIEDGIGEAKIGVILGYENDNDGTGWYKMVDGETKLLTGSMLAFADDTLNSLEAEIDKKPIALMLGYTYDTENGKWFKLADDGTTKNYMTGTMTAFADRNLSNIEQGVAETKIGLLLGYEKGEGDNWFKPTTPPTLVTGIMKTIANDDLQHLGKNLETKNIGELLGYTYIEPGDAGYVSSFANDYPSGYWVNPDSDTPTAPCSSFVQIMSNATLGTVDDLQKDITLGKLIPYDDRQTGFLSLLDSDTKIDNISEEVDNKFNTVTIEELAKCGAIDLSTDEINKLNAFPITENGENKTLATVTLKTFFSNIVTLLPNP